MSIVEDTLVVEESKGAPIRNNSAKLGAFDNLKWVVRIPPRDQKKHAHILPKGL